MTTTPTTDVRTLAPADLLARPHARVPTLDESLRWLASPEDRRPLIKTADGHGVTDGISTFPFRDGLPILLPARLQRFFDACLQVSAEAATDAFLKYFAMASLRHAGDINAPSSDVHFQRHLHRMHAFVRECSGLVLDVGCDDAALGAALFSERCTYLGLDPFCQRGTPFRLIGLGEFLPVRDECVDVVVFNTSLDHIFDWHRAIDEAHRILRPGGQLVIASLVWTESADLLRDSVHFHHFRDYEIFGALAAFTIEDAARYDYKGNTHRHGLYVRAAKR